MLNKSEPYQMIAGIGTVAKGLPKAQMNTEIILNVHAFLGEVLGGELVEPRYSILKTIQHHLSLLYLEETFKLSSSRN